VPPPSPTSLLFPLVKAPPRPDDRIGGLYTGPGPVLVYDRAVSRNGPPRIVYDGADLCRASACDTKGLRITLQTPIIMHECSADITATACLRSDGRLLACNAGRYRLQAFTRVHLTDEHLATSVPRCKRQGHILYAGFHQIRQRLSQFRFHAAIFWPTLRFAERRGTQPPHPGFGGTFKQTILLSNTTPTPSLHTTGRTRRTSRKMQRPNGTRKAAQTCSS
jgi:hypothetical protein